MSKGQSWSNHAEVSPAGEIRKGTPEFPDGVAKLHQVATGRLDFEVDVVAEVEFAVKVNTKVTSLSAIFHLNVVNFHSSR